MRRFSLAFLTVPDLGPLEAVLVAARAGYDSVGFRLLPATPEERPYSLLTDDRLLGDVRTALDDTGLTVGDVELIRLSPATNPRSFLAFFHRARQLGASQVIIVNDDADIHRVIDTFGKLCETAAPFGLTMNLEPMPWTQLPDLEMAKHIVAAAGQDNAGILVDAFHFYRRLTPITVLDDMKAHHMNIFQICDAPSHFIDDPLAIRQEARTERLVPGSGGLDLSSLICRFPESTVVSIEVPNNTLIETLSPLERSSLFLTATKKLYEQQEHGRAHFENP